MLFLVVSGFEEEGSNLFVTFLLCLGSEVGVLVTCLGLACEGSFQILFGLCTCVLCLHFIIL